MDLSDQKTQIILVIVLAALGGVYAWFTYIYSPQKQLVDDLTEEITTLENDIQVAQLTANRADDTLARLQEAQDRWTAILRSFPTEAHEEEVLTALYSAEQTARVYISNFEPGERRGTPLYFEQDYSIRLLGRYHDLGRFIAEIAAAQRRMSVKSMQISHPAAAEEGGGRGGSSTGPPPGEDELIINLVVTTYVVREQSGG